MDGTVGGASRKSLFIAELIEVVDVRYDEDPVGFIWELANDEELIGLRPELPPKPDTAWPVDDPDTLCNGSGGIAVNKI